MAGLPNLQGWGHFKPDYPSFPQELIEQICRDAELDGILGNKAASGTVIIQELGEEHLQTGRPICYTSADSCFQIAAHEKHFGLEKLYRLCEIAYKHVQPYRIGRVIARPFIGEKSGEFTRTTRRRDYAAQPFGDTLLDKALAAEKFMPSEPLMISMLIAASAIPFMPPNSPAYGTPRSRQWPKPRTVRWSLPILKISTCITVTAAMLKAMPALWNISIRACRTFCLA